MVASLISIITIIWAYQHGYIITYGDATAHLNISRRIIDNLTPGFAQLGNSWLPLLHLLMLPLIWNNFLWHTGLAGSIVSGLAFVGSAYFAYKSLLLTTGNQLVGWIAVLVLITNPNLLYMQTTPMNESLFILSVLGSVYFMLKWVKTAEVLSLVWCAAFAFTAAFNRYEGWGLVIGQAAVVGLIAYRRGRRQKATSAAINYLALAGFAPVIWLGWNWLIFGSPTDFLHNDFSARAQQVLLEESGRLPTAHSLIKSLHYFGWSIIDVFGWPLTILFGVSAAVTAAWTVFGRRWREWLPYWTAALPGLFLLYTLYKGVTVLHVPQLYPYQMFNVRYSLFIMPLVATVIALAAWKLWPLRIAALAVIAVQVGLFWHQPYIVALQDPLIDQQLEQGGTGELKAAQFLKEQYRGGRILASAATGNSIMLRSGIALRQFIHEGNRHYWYDALDNPTRAQWVITVGSNPKSTRDGVLKRLYRSPTLKNRFDKVFDEDGVRLYVLAGGPT